MNTLLTTILVLTFLGILSGLFFCIWAAYKIVVFTSSLSPEVNTCKYTPELDKSVWRIPTGIYHTGCGKKFNDSTEPVLYIADWMTYCPYCGGKVK